MRKFYLFEKELKLIGEVVEENGEILLHISGKEYVLSTKKDLNMHPEQFKNKITAQVDKHYKGVRWDDRVIAEISLELNTLYQNSVSNVKLKEVICNILEKHTLGNIKYYYAYRKYFEINGQIEKSKHKGKGIYYNINRDSLLPKKKKESKDLGILDELGML